MKSTSSNNSSIAITALESKYKLLFSTIYGGVTLPSKPPTQVESDIFALWKKMEEPFNNSVPVFRWGELCQSIETRLLSSETTQQSGGGGDQVSSLNFCKSALKLMRLRLSMITMMLNSIYITPVFPYHDREVEASYNTDVFFDRLRQECSILSQNNNSSVNAQIQNNSNINARTTTINNNNNSNILLQQQQNNPALTVAQHWKSLATTVMNSQQQECDALEQLYHAAFITRSNNNTSNENENDDDSSSSLFAIEIKSYEKLFEFRISATVQLVEVARQLHEATVRFDTVAFIELFPKAVSMRSLIVNKIVAYHQGILTSSTSQQQNETNNHGPSSSSASSFSNLIVKVFRGCPMLGLALKLCSNSLSKGYLAFFDELGYAISLMCQDVPVSSVPSSSNNNTNNSISTTTTGNHKTSMTSSMSVSPAKEANTKQPSSSSSTTEKEKESNNSGGGGLFSRLLGFIGGGGSSSSKDNSSNTSSTQKSSADQNQNKKAPPTHHQRGDSSSSSSSPNQNRQQQDEKNRLLLKSSKSANSIDSHHTNNNSDGNNNTNNATTIGDDKQRQMDNNTPSGSRQRGNSGANNNKDGNSDHHGNSSEKRNRDGDGCENVDSTSNNNNNTHHRSPSTSSPANNNTTGEAGNSKSNNDATNNNQGSKSSTSGSPTSALPPTTTTAVAAKPKESTKVLPQSFPGAQIFKMLGGDNFVSSINSIVLHSKVYINNGPQILSSTKVMDTNNPNTSSSIALPLHCYFVLFERIRPNHPSHQANLTYNLPNSNSSNNNGNNNNNNTNNSQQQQSLMSLSSVAAGPTSSSFAQPSLTFAKDIMLNDKTADTTHHYHATNNTTMKSNIINSSTSSSAQQTFYPPTNYCVRAVICSLNQHTQQPVSPEEKQRVIDFIVPVVESAPVASGQLASRESPEFQAVVRGEHDNPNFCFAAVAHSLHEVHSRERQMALSRDLAERLNSFLSNWNRGGDFIKMTHILNQIRVHAALNSMF